jgi:hypothetical protein
MNNIITIPTDREPIKGDLLLRHLWKGTSNECKSWWIYSRTMSFGGLVQYTTLNGSFRDVPSSFKVQDIYILEDSEVKDGEYGICLNLVREGFKSHQAVFKMNASQRTAMEELGGRKKAEVFKVILTTNPALIKDGVQKINDGFLNYFIKNPSCEWVEIQDWYNIYLSCCRSKEECYCNKKRIIIPNQNPQKTKTTLKERLRQELTGHLSDEKTEVDVNIAKRIARDFAIGFTKWKDDNALRVGLDAYKKIGDAENDKPHTLKKLLEIYEKEQGL